MTPPEARILELYRAFNGRDFDGFFDMLAADVNWTNDTDDSRLIGKDVLRAYILDETGALRAEYEPIQVKATNDGKVEVLAQQIILSTADGSVWSNTRVRHTFQLENNLVVRQDAERSVGVVDAGTEPLLTALYDAVDRRDIEAVMAVFHPEACVPDSLEHVMLRGRDEIRAYYLRLFATISIASSLLSTRLLADDSVEAFLHVSVRGAEGGFWWEGPVTMTYRTRDGLIVEMTVAEALGG